MSQPREDSLFQTALAMPSSERAAWLDRECSGDIGLRVRIQALLDGCTKNESGARSPKTEHPPELKLDFSSLPDEAIGESLGRYRLLEKIGEGGCGVVYVAEQSEPVRRRVALKVIKLGMDTRQVVARFEAERQALAMMDHPNIA